MTLRVPEQRPSNQPQPRREARPSSARQPRYSPYTYRHTTTRTITHTSVRSAASTTPRTPSRSNHNTPASVQHAGPSEVPGVGPALASAGTAETPKSNIKREGAHGTALQSHLCEQATQPGCEAFRRLRRWRCEYRSNARQIDRRLAEQTLHCPHASRGNARTRTRPTTTCTVTRACVHSDACTTPCTPSRSNHYAPTSVQHTGPSKLPGVGPALATAGTAKTPEPEIKREGAHGMALRVLARACTPAHT